MKYKILLLIMFLSSIAHSSVPSIETYLVSPSISGSRFVLVMMPTSRGYWEEGNGKCLEILDDGSFKERWSINWFANRGRVMLHPDGKSLVRIHQIEAPLTKDNYTKKPGLSFYTEGRLVGNVFVGELIEDYSSLSSDINNYACIKSIDSMRGLAAAHAMKLNENGKHSELYKELRREPIFRIETVELNVFFYTASGNLIKKITNNSPQNK